MADDFKIPDWFKVTPEMERFAMRCTAIRLALEGKPPALEFSSMSRDQLEEELDYERRAGKVEAHKFVARLRRMGIPNA
jgi:hypothetical protein